MPKPVQLTFDFVNGILTAERLRELLHYDPETGVFTWKLPSQHRLKPGAIAGRISSQGHRQVTIDRRAYQAHRLVWLFMTGQWPRGEIDHINGNRLDNCWRNLREATRIQNCANTGKRHHNRSGFKGVFPMTRGRWGASICVRGRNLNLGIHETPEQAHAAYCEAATRIHGEFARFR